MSCVDNFKQFFATSKPSDIVLPKKITDIEYQNSITKLNSLIMELEFMVKDEHKYNEKFAELFMEAHIIFKHERAMLDEKIVNIMNAKGMVEKELDAVRGQRLKDFEVYTHNFQKLTQKVKIAMENSAEIERKNRPLQPTNKNSNQKTSIESVMQATIDRLENEVLILKNREIDLRGNINFLNKKIEDLRNGKKESKNKYKELRSFADSLQAKVLSSIDVDIGLNLKVMDLKKELEKEKINNVNLEKQNNKLTEKLSDKDIEIEKLKLELANQAKMIAELKSDNSRKASINPTDATNL